MNRNVKRRGVRVTAKQKQIIVEFMGEHVDFARNKLLDVEGKIASHNLWQILSHQLNSNGPQKSVAKWQRVWTDIKIKVRRKTSGLVYSRRKPAGWHPDDITLDHLDDKVVGIISEPPIYGPNGPDSESLHSEEPVPRLTVRDMPRAPKSECFHEPVSSCSTNIQEPPSKKQEFQWTKVEEEEEIDTVSEQLSDNFDPLRSSACSENSSATPTPQQTDRRKRGHDELKQLSRQSTLALQEVAAELKSLNKNVNVLINQNGQMMTERKTTNSILLRIVRTLERQSTE